MTYGYNSVEDGGAAWQYSLTPRRDSKEFQSDIRKTF